MSDSLTEKFDRWWAENREGVRQEFYSVADIDYVRKICRSAFMAGAAAERIERVRDLQRMGEPATEQEIADALVKIAERAGGGAAAERAEHAEPEEQPHA